MSDWRSIPVANLELSVRAYNSITRLGLTTLGELYDYWKIRSKNQFIKDVSGAGMRTYREFQEILEPIKRNEMGIPRAPSPDVSEDETIVLLRSIDAKMDAILNHLSIQHGPVELDPIDGEAV